MVVVSSPPSEYEEPLLKRSFDERIALSQIAAPSVHPDPVAAQPDPFAVQPDPIPAHPDSFATPRDSTAAHSPSVATGSDPTAAHHGPALALPHTSAHPEPTASHPSPTTAHSDLAAARRAPATVPLHTITVDSEPTAAALGF
ncbi:hypothetical protein HDU98_003774 [Podochytrium sp. JEL0797]|nr:hypothetical protein HDU98_003774 [Podochytrium sp. JEL0797]